MTARPWPTPEGQWVLAQTWRNLLFMHWPVPSRVLQPLIPAGLELQTWAGDAWVGLVPFHLSYIAPRGVPWGWGLAFPEINLRTYVTAEGKPGVWFFSLDAASLLAVLGARIGLHLPYFWSCIQTRDDAGWIAFASRRRHPRCPGAEFVARYRPTGPVAYAAPGSLEDWFTARYCLYAAGPAGRLTRIEVHHAPWPLQPAEVDIAVETMFAAHGLERVGTPLLHFSRSIDVVAWLPERLERRGG